MISKSTVIVGLALAVLCLAPGGVPVARADVGAPVLQAAAVPATSPAEASGINAADTVWVLLSAGLVMLMTPGLAFFYGGLVRRKNILSILMQCFMMLCLVSLQWVFCGYTLAFGPDVGGVTGNLDWMGLHGVGLVPFAYAPNVPHLAFVIFQMMFAVITPALIIGAFAERVRFSAFCVFSLLWTTLVYDPVAHWMWGQGGFLGGRDCRARQCRHGRAGGGGGDRQAPGVPQLHLPAP